MAAGIGETRSGGLGPDEVRLLLVEDDRIAAEMYRLKLEIDGYTVTVAPDGESALRLATQTPLPDLVFLDIRLPGMDGFEVLERIRADERTRNLPVVILSNYGEDELVRRGRRLGVLEYLIKSQAPPGRVSSRVPGWTMLADWVSGAEASTRRREAPAAGREVAGTEEAEGDAGQAGQPLRRALIESPLPRPRIFERRG
jgi:CheY-like chemotaxis protein